MAALSEFLTGIANAIRTKKGSSGVIPAPRFAEEILGIQTGIDTSDATAQAGDLLAGKTAYGAAGKLTGTIPSKSASDLTASGANVAVPAGYYPAQVSKAVATATQATPGISVSTSGLITASATQGAGYVSAGTKQATRQLTTQGAQTITPGTSNKTIASGRYLTGTQTIKGDANLLPANIKKGVSIFGVAGTFAGESNFYMTEASPTLGSVDQLTVNTAFAPRRIYGFLINEISKTRDIYILAFMHFKGSDSQKDVLWVAKVFSDGHQNAYPNFPGDTAYDNTKITWTDTSVSILPERQWGGTYRVIVTD